MPLQSAKPTTSDKDSTHNKTFNATSNAKKPPLPHQQPHVRVEDIDMAALLEGAEDWDMDDELDTAHCHIFPQSSTRELCTRCTVEQVMPSDMSEKRLIVKVDGAPSTEKREVILTQDWIYTEVLIGDLINVLGTFVPNMKPSSSNTTPILTITLTSHENFLILHPDLLLSATTIANAPSCPRKPLLLAMLNASAPSPPTLSLEPKRTTHGQDGAMTWGNFIHRVMQRCMETKRWDRDSIESLVDEILRSPEGLGDLVKLGVSIERAKLEIAARAAGLEEFAKRFVGQTVKPDALLSDHTVDGVTTRLALTKLHSIEEDIWSPTYGLKGKLDASVQALIEQTKGNKTANSKFSKSEGGTAESRTMPFEIKTGRTAGVLEHRAQTMLYTLLIAERYGVEVPGGLLYYTQSKELKRVLAVRNELRGLVLARNELASYIVRKRVNQNLDDSAESSKQAFLPETIDDDYRCSKCYVVEGCMLYRKAVENVVDKSSPIAALYEEKTAHLTHTQCDFYKKWEKLISFEEQDSIRFRKELWTMKAEEREKTGRCFANMVVVEHKCDTTAGVERVHQHVYNFVRAASSYSTPEKNSLLNGSISVGDAVTVSIEPDLLALARGFVIEIDPYHIAIGFDHEVDIRGILKRTRSIDKPLSAIHCRLDKDEFTSGMSRIRDNLARLFYANGDKKRLALVVDLRAPEFDEEPELDDFEPPSNLNLNQQDALRKVLSAKDYAIILGMPGTGKTTTIAEIINVLVKKRKTVLLASYTHSAVDNILLKLGDAKYPILRLGSYNKVHPDVRKYTLAHQSPPTTIEQFEHQILRPPVVATTCLSVDHALFARRYFDYCIIDEASQVTLPTCLGPLRYADKFVLVGDHFQLPPLVRSRDAREGGLDVSLFRRLVEAHPVAVVDLIYQYRMNRDIMLLSNKLVYGDRLRCGSNAVAERTLVLANRTALDGGHAKTCRNGGCWMEKLLDERCRAVFVDTDMVPARESRVGDLIQNEVEARLVYNVTECLLQCGIKQSQIGIISLYRQQIKLLSYLLHCRKDVELLTADKSQGRDKDCIIISMVRSNASSQVGELVQDWRRVNVSFTRARSKLIIFGSLSTLRGSAVMEEFFKLVESKGWMMSLPAGADGVHGQRGAAGSAALKRGGAGGAGGAEDKENRGVDGRRKAKKARTDQGVLKGRPLLHDVANEAV